MTLVSFVKTTESCICQGYRGIQGLPIGHHLGTGQVFYRKVTNWPNNCIGPDCVGCNSWLCTIIKVYMLFHDGQVCFFFKPILVNSFSVVKNFSPKIPVS